jgi:KipI family sensor histidine kinase inhibitor
MPDPVRILPYGDRAVLVEVDGHEAVAAWSAAIRRGLGDRSAVLEIVPAARTVLVVVDPEVLPLAEVRAVVGALEPDPAQAPCGAIVEIRVRYDGADLADVAATSGLAVADVVRLHSTATYTSAFCGFAPGFAYLTGLDPRLQFPRRATPRPKVPKGSVAIASEYCGIYPNDMPGGWHLLGHTDTPLWDLGRAEPALLPPGTRVRFVPVDAPVPR